MSETPSKNSDSNAEYDDMPPLEQPGPDSTMEEIQRIVKDPIFWNYKTREQLDDISKRTRINLEQNVVWDNQGTRQVSDFITRRSGLAQMYHFKK